MFFKYLPINVHCMYIVHVRLTQYTYNMNMFCPGATLLFPLRSSLNFVMNFIETYYFSLIILRFRRIAFDLLNSRYSNCFY